MWMLSQHSVKYRMQSHYFQLLLLFSAAGTRCYCAFFTKLNT